MNAGNGAVGTRGALPRLRGRGKQGDYVTYILFRSALCIGLSERYRAQDARGGVPYDVSLLLTASQARQRSSGGPDANPTLYLRSAQTICVHVCASAVRLFVLFSFVSSRGSNSWFQARHAPQAGCVLRGRNVVLSGPFNDGLLVFLPSFNEI